MLTVTASWNSGTHTLDVDSDIASDSIAITKDNFGNVKVTSSGTPVTITNGPAHTTNVYAIDLDAGDGNDYVDISGVSVNNGFTGPLDDAIFVSGDGGHDYINGSPFDDDIEEVPAMITLWTPWE